VELARYYGHSRKPIRRVGRRPVEGDGGPGRSPRAKGLALAALSLVCLVVAAVATPEGPPFDTDPSGVVTPRVPTVVGLVLLVFGVVAAMGVAYLVLVTAGVPDDYRARRRRLWATLAALMAVAAIVAIAASASRPLGEDDRGLNEPVQEQRDERAVPPDPSSRSTDALGAAVALLLGLGFLGVAAAAIYRRRA
jgi:hypothetical protein